MASLISLRSIRTEPYSVDEVEEIFRPVFVRIAGGALAREQARTLPFDEVGWLKERRFGALRVPVAHGGYGLDHAGTFRLLIELAAADPNVCHLFRGHFAVVEETLGDPDPSIRAAWLDRFGRGDIVGNASTEPGEASVKQKSTRLSRREGRWLLNGTKFYTTGSIFADWIDISASREVDDAYVAALAPRNHPGVVIHDDWDGFGQKLTGTGTGTFTDVPVEPNSIRERDGRLPYLAAALQSVLLATLAGIARSILADGTEQLRRRTRVFSHGNSDLARNDPQLQQVIGELAAAAFAAEALVFATADAFGAAARAAQDPDRAVAIAAASRVEIAVNKAQVAIADIVPRAATRLFDALGASAVRSDAALDRHWRNARVVLSHNPVLYRARTIGDHLVNDGAPDLAWSVGVSTQAG
ncbi:acyl-CoA dehydrogenase family protein [Enterovirga rhinocerotis]|uniref:Dibenzothiophene monooxygenase n=1 Tax=Enterovirga rhinocerotis TaxID=1339210 RepID=A0A4V6PZE4_9HYPH|nr:acyl-CoA dehydrogenase family protein [Enterovirga rhinocerotis]TDR85259.1 alkylation response protein AidB-like acyl-CoA dehydrogenase [Enterovirga rhinocerotis]